MTIIQASSAPRYRWKINSPVGELRLFACGDRLAGIYFDAHKPAPKDTSGIADVSPFAAVIRQLDAYFAGSCDRFRIPLDLEGTEFQQAVWSELQMIPYGKTKSYSEVAVACGRSKAVRAVGAAVGRNPISIVIPCHRVVGANGALTGFAGGVQRKKFLLGHESHSQQK